MTSVDALVNALVVATQGLPPVTALSKTGRRKRIVQARTLLGALLGLPVDLHVDVTGPFMCGERVPNMPKKLCCTCGATGSSTSAGGSCARVLAFARGAS